VDWNLVGKLYIESHVHIRIEYNCVHRFCFLRIRYIYYFGYMVLITVALFINHTNS